MRSPRRKLTTSLPHSAIAKIKDARRTVPRLPCTPNNEHAKPWQLHETRSSPQCNQDWRARARNTFGMDHPVKVKPTPSTSGQRLCGSPSAQNGEMRVALMASQLSPMKDREKLGNHLDPALVHCAKESRGHTRTHWWTLWRQLRRQWETKVRRRSRRTWNR